MRCAVVVAAVVTWRALTLVGDCDKTSEPRIELASELLKKTPVGSEPTGLAEFRHNLGATVILVHRRYEKESPLLLKEKTKINKGKCSDGSCSWERRLKHDDWIDKPSLAICSGVLVRKDVVLTPRHCLCYFGAISDIRVHPANWMDEGEREWRSVVEVKVPPESTVNSCSSDFVFLKLSGALGDPVQVRGDTSSVDEESAYMIASPLGIPGTVTSGKVKSGTKVPGCYNHDMYAVRNSSGGAIFDTRGQLIGIHSRPSYSELKCSCPRVVEKKLWFPNPNAAKKLGRYIRVSQKTIGESLNERDWIPSEQFQKPGVRNMVCDETERQDLAPLWSQGLHWQC